MDHSEVGSSPSSAVAADPPRFRNRRAGDAGCPLPSDPCVPGAETPKEEEVIPPDEMPNPDAELSPGYQRSKDLLDKHVGSIIDGTLNDSIMKQPAGTTAEKMNNTSTVPEETSSFFDTSEFLNNFRQSLVDKMNFQPNFPFGS